MFGVYNKLDYPELYPSGLSGYVDSKVRFVKLQGEVTASRGDDTQKKLNALMDHLGLKFKKTDYVVVKKTKGAK